MEALQALNFNVWSFLANVINLLITIGILYIIGYKPVTKLLLEREQQIEGAINEAAQKREEAYALLSKYEEQIQNARSEAQAIIANATKVGEEMKEEIIRNAQQEAAKMLERAKTEIEMEKARALKEIKEEMATLVVLAAGRVINKELTLQDHERLIHDFITEAGELQ
ncbi:MAG TPA: F0F1 ATP synthase subunit B [Clostridia bacterium]|nr:F0F1 ATP synthase subunit B [Clostridia bacterium]